MGVVVVVHPHLQLPRGAVSIQSTKQRPSRPGPSPGLGASPCPLDERGLSSGVGGAIGSRGVATSFPLEVAAMVVALHTIPITIILITVIIVVIVTAEGLRSITTIIC